MIRELIPIISAFRITEAGMIELYAAQCQHLRTKWQAIKQLPRKRKKAARRRLLEEWKFNESLHQFSKQHQLFL